jgi:dTDP-4-amino-4,6-dideoxygalactose transaminase
MKIKNILNYLPLYPHYKMNVFSGTNTFSEIKDLLNYRLKGDNDNKQYEKIISQTLNSKDIFTFASGRMGFYTILKALDIQKDDEVIIPSFTCVVVPNAILYSGAKPIYCDILTTDFNIDVSKIEQLITVKTKVLYAQHTFGQMCDIDNIIKIAKKYNLVVVEDTAGALGAKLHNKYAGTIGDFGYFSTDRTKVINTGLGGIVSVNNNKYIKRFSDTYRDIPYLSDSFSKKIAKTFIFNIITLHPYIYWLGKFINAILSKSKIMTYLSDETLTNKEKIKNYPYPARLSNLMAKIGLSQFKLLNKNLGNRKKIANYYNQLLNIYSKQYMQNDKNIFLRYSFLVKNRDYWESRFSSKIDLSIWFKTIAFGRNDDFEKINYKINSNKVSEYVCKHIFNLPTHNQIKAEKLQSLLKELKNSNDIITKDKLS